MPEIKSIAIFNPSLHIGGTERVVVNLANGFVRQGITVYLLLARAGGVLLDEIHESVIIVDFGKRGVFDSIPSLVKFLRDVCPSVFLSAQSHANLMALIAAKMAGFSSSLVVRQQTTLSMAGKMEPGIKNRFVPMLTRLLYTQADAVVCISQGVADDVLENTRLTVEKVRRIYNPVIPFDAELDQRITAPLDHPWFHEDAPPVILAVGRLTRAKDYPTLVRAFALARQECEIRLIILGEGEDRIKLENLVNSLGIEADVQLPGAVDNPYPYMASCSVFVFSSIFEGLGNVLIEALACGARIIATDCKYGPAEILADGRYGSLVPVGNAPAMAKAIITSLNSEKKHFALRKRANDFSQENIVQQYLDLFVSLYES